MNDSENQSSDQPSVRSSASPSWSLLVGLTILSILVVAVILRRSSLPVQDSPAIGKRAPQFDLVLLSNDLSLEPVQSLPAGKVTLLHLWGTWCGPCREEFPHLSQLVAGYENTEAFHFLPVACESSRDETFAGLWEKTSAYYREQGIQQTAYADPRGVTRRSVAERLERSSLFYPTSILIAANGQIAGVWEGYSPESIPQIKRITDELLTDATR